jgi:hypothetical protein
MQKADIPKSRYTKKPIYQKADMTKSRSRIVNLSRRGYVAHLGKIILKVIIDHIGVVSTETEI